MTRERALFRTAPALLLGAILLTGPVALGAQEEGAAPAARAEDDRAPVWRARLGELHTQLTEKSYEEAVAGADALAEDMKAHLGVGEEAAYTMAVVAAFRAIAEVGLGNREDGLWYWRIATNLHPSFAERDLTAYGEPAVWLTDQAYRGDLQSPNGGSAVMAPRVSDSQPIELPGTVADLDTGAVEIVVDTVVGIDGRPREPRIVSAPEVPAVIYAGLEGLKDWRFAPATFDGKPVAVAHEVTVPMGG